MAKAKLDFGVEIDLLNQQELHDTLGDQFANWEYQRLRGTKHMRLPETLAGKSGLVTAGTLTLGETTGQHVGPEVGYSWTIMRLVVNGLTSGSTPDVVNLYRGTPAGIPLWQFNGNNFGYTFGKLEITLNGGETFALASVGTFAATGQITLSGELIEVPAELVGKIA